MYIIICSFINHYTVTYQLFSGLQTLHHYAGAISSSFFNVFAWCFQGGSGVLFPACVAGGIEKVNVRLGAIGATPISGELMNFSGKWAWHRGGHLFSLSLWWYKREKGFPGCTGPEFRARILGDYGGIAFLVISTWEKSRTKIMTKMYDLWTPTTHQHSHFKSY